MAARIRPTAAQIAAYATLMDEEVREAIAWEARETHSLFSRVDQGLRAIGTPERFLGPDIKLGEDEK